MFIMLFARGRLPGAIVSTPLSSKARPPGAVANLCATWSLHVLSGSLPRVQTPECLPVPGTKLGACIRAAVSHTESEE